jgi:hypothetical protein
MKNKLRIAGLLLASLTVSTVALAQQGGGGGGGGQGGAAGGGGDNSIIALRLQDHERARLSRAVEPRRAGSNCLTHACNEPPMQRPPARIAVQLIDSCGGGDYWIARDRSGRIIRRVCEFD